MSIRLDIERRVSFAEGASFGDMGPYERLVGKVFFAVDPADPALAGIVDLDLAPRNPDGRVEFAGDLDILKPVEASRGNGAIFYDMNNRGNRSVLRAFNEAAGSNDPQTAAHAGNGFLMRQGYTVVWSGWQGDLVPGSGLAAYLPEARQNGGALRGTVRQEFITERKDLLSMPVSGGANIACYPVLDPATATLTRREHEQDPREELPRDEWQIAKAERDATTGSVSVTPSNIDLYVKEGFRPGWIYELIYETEGSKVMGLGLFGVRELVSFLRYDTADAAGAPNPLAGAIDRAYAYGSSMSARVVRQFVYEGYNEDTAGRKVFDGIQTQVAGGGRVFVNQRFAQVGRFPRQHEEHEWPSEVYPFAYSPVPDPFSEKVDSVLKRPGTDPLVMHTHSSSEYWQRHASLGHTDPASGEDLESPDGVRMYYLTGFPHAAGGGGPDFPGQLTPNAQSAAPYLRACLTLLDRWVTTGAAPPANRLPQRSDGTLAPPEQVLARFPKVPGVHLPASPSRLPLFDYGPDFDRGIVTQHPPLPRPGAEYPVQLPQVDADGNEIPGLRSPDMEVPLGTYTGWNLRRAGHAEGDLYGLNGSFIPFERTRSERQATGDPRPSIEERYASHEAYVQAIDQATARLVADGLLLEEDARRYREAARERNPLDPSVALGPLLAASGTP